MEEVVIVASARETEGLGVFDVATGASLATPFKNACSESPNVLCSIGGGSSYLGQGRGGDFIAIGLPKKPQINIYQWGKSQAHLQCHVQEISSCLACDPSGTYLFSGSKSGRLFVWEVSTGNLITAFQAHFKCISAIAISACGSYFVTGSTDGMVRLWDTVSVVATDPAAKNASNRNISPYRSWSPHTMPVTGVMIQGAGVLGASPLRVLTCAMDRTVCLFDVSANRQIYRQQLPEAAECMATNPMGDFIAIGSTSGAIYALDSTLLAHSIHATSTRKESITSKILGKEQGSSEAIYSTLEGHSRKITGLSFSMDNCTMVSGSEDGSVRVWDIWTKQCVREFKPLNKCGISSILLTMAPAALSLGEQKMSCTPLGHLRKYRVDDAAANPTSVPVPEAQSSDAMQGKKSSNNQSSNRPAAGASAASTAVTPLRYVGAQFVSQSDRKPWSLRSGVRSDDRSSRGPDAIYRSEPFPGTVGQGARGNKRKSEGDEADGELDELENVQQDRPKQTASLGSASFVRLPDRANEAVSSGTGQSKKEKEPTRISTGGSKKKRS